MQAVEGAKVPTPFASFAFRIFRVLCFWLDVRLFFRRELLTVQS